MISTYDHYNLKFVGYNKVFVDLSMFC